MDLFKFGWIPNTISYDSPNSSQIPWFLRVLETTSSCFSHAHSWRHADCSILHPWGTNDSPPLLTHYQDPMLNPGVSYERHRGARECLFITNSVSGKKQTQLTAPILSCPSSCFGTNRNSFLTRRLPTLKSSLPQTGAIKEIFQVNTVLFIILVIKLLSKLLCLWILIVARKWWAKMFLFLKEVVSSLGQLIRGIHMTLLPSKTHVNTNVPEVIIPC